MFCSDIGGPQTRVPVRTVNLSGEVRNGDHGASLLQRYRNARATWIEKHPRRGEPFPDVLPKLQMGTMAHAVA